MSNIWNGLDVILIFTLLSGLILWRLGAGTRYAKHSILKRLQLTKSMKKSTQNTQEITANWYVQ